MGGDGRVDDYSFLLASLTGQASRRDAEMVALEARLAGMEEARAGARREADEKTAEVEALKTQAREREREDGVGRSGAWQS